MEPVSAAIIGLTTKYLPEIISLFTDNKKAAKTASVVSQVAKDITGATTLQGIDSALQNSPELVVELRKAVMADAHIAEQMRLADVAGARDMYKATDHMQADTIANNIMKWNLIMVFVLVVINVLAVIYLASNAAVLAIVSNFIGIVLHALLNERQSVTGFYFGSSMTNKSKDKTIEQLSKEK